MKYQSLNDLIDPDVPPTETAVESAGDDDPGAPDDAYVIGEGGNTVKAPAGTAARKSRAGPKPWAKPAAFLLGALFVVMTVWNLSHLLQGPPPPPKPSPFQVKQALYLGVMKVDAYRRVHGVAPDSLADLGLSETGPYAYQRIDSAHYVLSFHGNGPTLEYDSSDSKERFFGSPQEILTMGDSK